MSLMDIRACEQVVILIAAFTHRSPEHVMIIITLRSIILIRLLTKVMHSMMMLSCYAAFLYAFICFYICIILFLIILDTLFGIVVLSWVLIGRTPCRVVHQLMLSPLRETGEPGLECAQDPASATTDGSWLVMYSFVLYFILLERRLEKINKYINKYMFPTSIRSLCCS